MARAQVIEEFQHVDYSKVLDSIINLKESIGPKNAKEDLRRFVHNVRDYEYSGNFNNIKSKLLITGEVVKSVMELCKDNKESNQTREFLNDVFAFNLDLYKEAHSFESSAERIEHKLQNLSNDNKFTILLCKAREGNFALVLERSFKSGRADSLKNLSKLIAACSNEKYSKKFIIQKLNQALKKIKTCPIKIHCIDRSISQNSFGKIVNLNDYYNIKIFNFYNGRSATGHIQTYDFKNKKTDQYSLNIIYSISYVLAKRGFIVDLSNKEIKRSTDNDIEFILKTNTENIIEHTINKISSEDKYVLGSLDRKFGLNYKVKNNPLEVKQININELDEDGLYRLKDLVKARIKIVANLKTYSKDLSNSDFDIYLDKNKGLVPQLIIEQLYLSRAKLFFERAEKLYDKGEFIIAIENYEEVLKLDKDFKEAALKKGTALYKLKRYEEAIIDLSRVITLDEFSTEALYLRGMCFAETRILQKSRDDFDRILELEKKLI